MKEEMDIMIRIKRVMIRSVSLISFPFIAYSACVMPIVYWLQRAEQVTFEIGEFPGVARRQCFKGTAWRALLKVNTV